ncbi:MAG: formate dehydrogenase accessory sulfurtransferase FdhD [Thiotrichales bacterium]
MQSNSPPHHHRSPQTRLRLTRTPAPIGAPVRVHDEQGDPRDIPLTGERPLALLVDRHEIVTLMTCGAEPELLALGYLLNQSLIESIENVVAIETNWDKDAVAIQTRFGIRDLEAKLARRIVTSGCGQGTIFGRLMSEFEDLRVPAVSLRQSQIYALLGVVGQLNRVYRTSGSVHSCGLCRGSEPVFYVEDVGRHNAADAIAGYMAYEGIAGADKLFYTTGRLTSEMVIKVARMGVPVLISRNGATAMGHELAVITGMTLIGRAKGHQFIVYHGHQNIDYDAPPQRHRRPSPAD